jgi:hypothetical protein
MSTKKSIGMDTDGEPIEKLQVVPLRHVFPHEAHQFTKWLEENIDALSERLAMSLMVVQREQAVGDFNVDLLCEDANGQRVIIENQLEQTDHRHLGQLLTYLINLDAKVAIWVASEPRSEHQKVIAWLNESTPADISFYLVKIETIRIGGSPIAPLFTVLAEPDQQVKEIGQKKKEWADRHFSRIEFWKGLLENSKGKTNLFSNISPSKDNWIAMGAGKSGVTFNYYILMNQGEVTLYIDHDHVTGQKNKAIFDALYAHKDEIELEFGEPLEWKRLDESRHSRIEKTIYEGGLAKPDTWPFLQEHMIDAMIRLYRSLHPRVEKIQL